MLTDSLTRFRSDYAHRFWRYLLVMVLTIFIVYAFIKITGDERQILKFLKFMFGTSSSRQSNNFLPLFWHNLTGSILIIVLGVLPVPLYWIFLVYNAASVGMVLAFVNNPYLGFLTGILPHGIFEVSAQVISALISARIVWYQIDKLRHRSVQVSFGQLIKQTLDDILIYVVPLYFIAAIIETYLTPLLLNLAHVK
ncbi:stage II sporulation protein M [Lentilactobacillus senioris]|uniref:stage II sporulation protein M n=1 Tax=Lentilactobacillus senioris TaxID=931534 RepID=UPI003D29BC08